MSRMRHINMQQSSKYKHISEGRQLLSTRLEIKRNTLRICWWKKGHAENARSSCDAQLWLERWDFSQLAPLWTSAPLSIK